MKRFLTNICGSGWVRVPSQPEMQASLLAVNRQHTTAFIGAGSPPAGRTRPVPGERSESKAKRRGQPRT